MPLTLEQKQAAESRADYLRIIAPPGSGKTTTMVSRIRHLTTVRGVSPYQVCAITFTRAAAEELRARLQRLGGPPGQVAAKGFIGTSHALCLKIIRQWGSAIGVQGEGISVYDEVDQRDIIKAICRELGVSGVKPRDVIKALASEVLASVDEREVSDEAWLVAREYVERLRENNAVDFDLLLVWALRILRMVPAARGYYQDLYRCVIYDEFQDIAEEEYELLLLLRPRMLSVVGDPNQELYGFRGTDSSFLRSRFVKDFPAAETVSLSVNFRSCKNIVDAAMRLMGDEATPMSSPHPGGMVLEDWGDDEYNEAARIAGKIKKYLKSGVAPRRIAVLFRTNRQASLAASVLESEGIEVFLVNSALRFLEFPEVRHFISILRAVHNPRDSYSVESALSQILSPVELAEAKVRARSEGTSLYSVVREAGEMLGPISTAVKNGDLVTVLEVAQAVEARFGVAKYFAKAGRTTKAKHVRMIPAFLASWQKVFESNHTLEAFVEWYAVRAASDLADAGADKVKVMTVHQAKGREFEVVFLGGLYEGSLPSAKAESLEEERRIAYVAVTRAEDVLHLSSPVTINDGKVVTKSRFLTALL